jgi:hypothetical protein
MFIHLPVQAMVWLFHKLVNGQVVLLKRLR